MAVKLHRCRLEWLKTGPWWKVERALMGIDYELAPGRSRPNKRDKLIEHTVPVSPGGDASGGVKIGCGCP
jgi:hypothetical protein